MAADDRNGSAAASASAQPVASWYSSHIWLAPLVTVLLLALVAVVVQQQVKAQDRRARMDADLALTALANKYAESMRLLVSIADQFLLTVKWEAEEHPSKVNLERMQAYNLLPTPARMRISLADAAGFLRQSTSPLWIAGGAVDVRDRPFFKELARNPDAGVIFYRAQESKVTARPALLMARRINLPDGSFGGAVIIGADVDVFLTFLDADELPPGSYTGLLGADGSYLAFRPAMPEFAAHMDRPPAALRAEGRGLLVQETAPGDPGSRSVAWKRIPGYQLTAVVSQTAAGTTAANREARAIYYKEGLSVSLLILLVGGTWFVAAYRARARHHKQASSVQAYRMAAEGSNDAFIVQKPLYGVDGRIVDFVVTDCNRRAEVMHGLARGALTGVRLSQLSPGEDQISTYAQIMHSGVPAVMNDVEVKPGGMIKARWISYRLIPFEEGISVTIQDVSASKEHERALADMAFTDALTGLPNRRWLTENLPQVLQRCAAGSTQAALLFIDLDNFKAVNDTLGHEVGDALLQAAAASARSAIREHDVLCRLGGDELTVILESFASIDEVTRVCERILARLSSPVAIAGVADEMVVGASIGVSLYPADGDEAGALIKCADLAMYNAKEAGKGTFRFYSAQLSARAERRVAMEQALRQAITRDELVLVYQPKVSLGPRSAVIGSEALLRWYHPQRGLVLPAEFIGLAEESGLIDAIGHHVLHLACKQLCAWRAAGIALLPVSINVSPHQFVSGDIATAIATALAAYGLPGRLLEIEVTEQSMLGHPREVKKLLTPLKAMGVRVAVDDFGTGYSNLAQLNQLDVDVLKIDHSFVSQVPANAGVGGVVAAVIQMAKAMHMSVVAEGVETEEQLAFLARLDCHAVQGHYYSVPVMADRWADAVQRIHARIADARDLVASAAGRRGAREREGR